MTKEEMLKRAEESNYTAQERVVRGYAEGEYGFKQDPAKLIECTKKWGM